MKRLLLICTILLTVPCARAMDLAAKRATLVQLQKRLGPTGGRSAAMAANDSMLRLGIRTGFAPGFGPDVDNTPGFIKNMRQMVQREISKIDAAQAEEGAAAAAPGESEDVLELPAAKPQARPDIDSSLADLPEDVLEQLRESGALAEAPPVLGEPAGAGAGVEPEGPEAVPAAERLAILLAKRSSRALPQALGVWREVSARAHEVDEAQIRELYGQIEAKQNALVALDHRRAEAISSGREMARQTTVNALRSLDEGNIVDARRGILQLTQLNESYKRIIAQAQLEARAAAAASEEERIRADLAVLRDRERELTRGLQEKDHRIALAKRQIAANQMVDDWRRELQSTEPQAEQLRRELAIVQRDIATLQGPFEV